MAIRMQQRTGTLDQWSTANPILNAAEIGYESDTNKFKIGDGTNHWNDLPYFLDEDSLGESLDGYIPESLLGANNGVAQLNSSGKLVSTQIPNVDEITQDAINTALVAGTGLDKTYDDNANTITLDIDSTVATKTYVDNAIDSFEALPTQTGNTGKFLTTDGSSTSWATVDLSSKQDKVTGVSDTEIGYLDGVTSSIQTQINAKLDSTTAASTYQSIVSGVSSTEIGYLDGVTSGIQAQIDAKAATADIAELAQDAVNTSIVAGTGLDKTYDDSLNTITLDIDSTVTTNDGTQTLTNKTLTSPTINGATVGGDIVPSSDGTYDLGSSTNKFKDLYLSGSTLYLDTATVEVHSGNIVLSHSGNSTTIPLAGGAHTAATESYVDSAISGLVDLAPGALNTLNELAAAIGDDENYAATITTALGNKAPLESPTFTGTVSGVTKSHVGLGNVDNTSDANKPVSSATQTALDLKAPLANPTFTGTVAGVTKSHVGLGNVDNTSDAGKPVSTATQTALDLKANLNAPTFTGTVDFSGATVTGLPAEEFVQMATVSVSSNVTLQSNKRYFVDTAASRTLTLPASPANGDEVQIFDVVGSAATNSIIVDSNSLKINGTVQNLEIDIDYDIVALIYTGSTYGWVVL